MAPQRGWPLRRRVGHGRERQIQGPPRSDVLFARMAGHAEKADAGHQKERDGRSDHHYHCAAGHPRHTHGCGRELACR